jgi:hypothetical protein
MAPARTFSVVCGRVRLSIDQIPQLYEIAPVPFESQHGQGSQFEVRLPRDLSAFAAQPARRLAREVSFASLLIVVEKI